MASQEVPRHPRVSSLEGHSVGTAKKVVRVGDLKTMSKPVGVERDGGEGNVLWMCTDAGACITVLVDCPSSPPPSSTCTLASLSGDFDSSKGIDASNKAISERARDVGFFPSPITSFAISLIRQRKH